MISYVDRRTTRTGVVGVQASCTPVTRRWVGVVDKVWMGERPSLGEVKEEQLQAPSLEEGRYLLDTKDEASLGAHHAGTAQCLLPAMVQEVG